VAAIPAATYQWFKDGTAISSATDATLRIENVGMGDAADYTVTVMNESGCVTSQAAAFSKVNTPLPGHIRALASVF
jgi:hypothetical protein